MRFKLEYVDKVTPEKSSALMRGTVVHEVIAERLAEIKASKEVGCIDFEDLRAVVPTVRERLAKEGTPTSVLPLERRQDAVEGVVAQSAVQIVEHDHAVTGDRHGGWADQPTARFVVSLGLVGY